MSFLKSYKPGQAKTSRTITNVTGVFLIAWGGLALVQTLPRIHAKSLGTPINRLMDETVAFKDGWMVDVVIMNTPVNVAFVVGVVVTLVALLWWQRFLNTERWAEMLIDMEGEMRKVSWPSASDAWQSTLVVTGCTALLVALISVYDVVINRVLALFT